VGPPGEPDRCCAEVLEAVSHSELDSARPPNCAPTNAHLFAAMRTLRQPFFFHALHIEGPMPAGWHWGVPKSQIAPSFQGAKGCWLPLFSRDSEAGRSRSAFVSVVMIFGCGLSPVHVRAMLRSMGNESGFRKFRHPANGPSRPSLALAQTCRCSSAVLKSPPGLSQ